MPVQQEVRGGNVWNWVDDERLYHAEFLHAAGDGPILSGGAQAGDDGARRHDFGEVDHAQMRVERCWGDRHLSSLHRHLVVGDPHCKPLGNGVQTLGFEQRREVVVGEDLSQRARDDQKTFLGAVRACAKRPLFCGRVLVGSDTQAPAAYHRIGKRAFELQHALNFAAVADRLQREWRGKCA